MSASSETPHPPATPEFGFVEPGAPAHTYPSDDPLRVKKFSLGPFDNNVYVVESDGEAILVDGATEPERILSELDGLTVRAIVQTHNHRDHIQALPQLVEALGVTVYAHPADPMGVETVDVHGGEHLPFGMHQLVAIHTPGHTPGSVCYLVGSHLFSGDTLFPGGTGGTGGDRRAFDRIMASVDRLFRLPDDTHVHPGHGLDTAIGRERPHVQVWRERGW